MEINPDIIGSIAAILTTFCFVPQVMKALTAPDTKAISLYMYVFFTIGVILWLIYGIMLGKLPIIAANSVTVILSITILYKKVKNIVNKID